MYYIKRITLLEYVEQNVNKISDKTKKQCLDDVYKIRLL
jgi:hypothetical protein